MNLGSNAEQLHLPFQKLIDESRDSTNRNPKTIPKKNIILSERDYEILSFIFEMKFASLDQVYQKFFKSFGPAGEEFGFYYGKKRLVQLEQCGFLKSTKEFFNSKRLFWPTYCLELI
jgi:hypothetical protein